MILWAECKHRQLARLKSKTYYFDLVKFFSLSLTLSGKHSFPKKHTGNWIRCFLYSSAVNFRLTWHILPACPAVFTCTPESRDPKKLPGGNRRRPDLKMEKKGNKKSKQRRRQVDRPVPSAFSGLESLLPLHPSALLSSDRLQQHWKWLASRGYPAAR